MLAHGLVLDHIYFGSSSEEGKRVQHVRESTIYARSSLVYPSHPILTLYVNEWSDDYEPNKGSKANCGTIWIKTVTISPPVGELHSLHYTYPIAVGRNGISHEEVELCFSEELLSFRSGQASNLF